MQHMCVGLGEGEVSDEVSVFVDKGSISCAVVEGRGKG